jgi:hypothetical protein
MLMLDPENIIFDYITDTHFKSSKAEEEAGYQAYDGTKEEYLTEGTWEFHFPETFMYLTNVGDDGTA